jgi:multiple sugar transport system substrate-binding protein
MMRRVFILLILFVVMVVNGLMFAGEKKVEAKEVTLLFWTHEDPNRTPLEEGYIKEFQEKYPNVTVKRVTYPSRKIQEKILTAFAVRKGPHIFNMEINDEYQYILNARVGPLDPKAAGYQNKQAIYDAYLEGTLDAVTYKGDLYGLPLELTNWCLFLNKKYFREVGLDPEKDYPKTWEKMLEVAEKITIREGEIIKRRAFDFRYPYYLISWLPMVQQLGGSFLSEDGKRSTINSEAGLQVLQYMAEWGPNGRNFGSPTYRNARKTFNKDDGSVAMCLSGLYQIARIEAENSAFYESKEWSVVPFPRFADAVSDNGCNYYGHFYMVNAEKPDYDREIAWRLIAYMLKHPEEYMAEVGLIQPKKSLLASEVYKNYPYANVFIEDMAKSSPVMLHKDAPKLQELIKEAVESVMLAGVDPKEALERMERKTNEILGE